MAEPTTRSAARPRGGFDRMLRRLAVQAVLLAVAFGAGWLSQYSARQVADARAADARLRVPVLEARGYLLDARIDLQAANFGEAQRHLALAREAVDRAGKAVADPALRARLDAAFTRAMEAQSRAAQLDRNAATSAATASASVDALLASLPPTSPPD